MKRPLERGPITIAVAVCVAAGIAEFAMPRLRMTGPLAFAPLAAVGIWWLAVALLASRIWDLATESRRPAVLGHLVRIVALLIGNLLLLDLVLTAVAVIGRHAGSQGSTVTTVVLMALAAPERVVAAMVYRLLKLAMLVGVMLLLVRGLATAAQRAHVGPLAARVGVGAVVTLVIAECWFVLGLNVAGVLPLPTVVYKTRVADVRVVRLPLGLSALTTLGVRPWRADDGVVRVAVAGSDQIARARLAPGRPLVVTARTLGPLGLAMVQHIGDDREAGVPALVAAMPSAEWPRKWLITILASEGRWQEALVQLREYRRYYPRDDEIVRGFVFELRQHRQIAMARAVEGEFLR